MFTATRVVRFAIGVSLVLAMVGSAQAQYRSYGGHHHHHHPHHGHLHHNHLHHHAQYVWQPTVTYLQPAPLAQVNIPTLGFFGHVDPNWGMVVDSVVQGSIAQQLGLETNDAIVEINGQPIRSQGDYFAAMQACGGRGSLLVFDWRTRRHVLVSTTLAPLDPYSYNGTSGLYSYPNVVRSSRPLVSSVARGR